jgi:hypothetical protein
MSAISVLLFIVAVAGVSSCGDEPAARPTTEVVPSATDADLTFTIPRGTWTRILRGEEVELIPNPLRMKVGEVIRILNEDTVGFDIGPFYVGAHETMTQRMATAGTYTGACSLDPTGEVTLIVER